jgi:hypothetical protein
MYDAVLLQGADVSECFITDSTLMRFLSSVYESMLLQLTRPTEYNITDVTFKSFLSGAENAMLLHISSNSESFVRSVTLIMFHPSVFGKCMFTWSVLLNAALQMPHC